MYTVLFILLQGSGNRICGLTVIRLYKVYRKDKSKIAETDLCDRSSDVFDGLNRHLEFFFGRLAETKAYHEVADSHQFCS